MLKKNAFSGNPLIPGKQDKATISKLLPLLTRASAIHPASEHPLPPAAASSSPTADGADRAQGAKVPCILPVSKGKVLVWSKAEEAQGGREWGLAWQTFSDLGIPTTLSHTSGTAPGAQSDAPTAPCPSEWGLTLDSLIYLGEADGTPYFAVELPSDALQRHSPKLHPLPPSSAPAQPWCTPGAVPQQLAPAAEAGSELPAQGAAGAAAKEAVPGAQTAEGEEVAVGRRKEAGAADGGAVLAFVDMRTLFLAADPDSPPSMAELAIAGHARALAEWHRQTQFCGTCGSPTLAVEAGNRRTCSSGACGVRAYPRIDPVVIMLILHPSGERAVLSRQPKFPPGMYSCNAGFMEVGESLEESVVREVREEVGLTVSRVVYHSSQPWPVGFGSMQSQLMVGFVAVVSTFDIVTELDELEDARWFTREEVSKGLNFGLYKKERHEAVSKIHSTGTGVRSKAVQSQGGAEYPSFYVPGPFAIAHVLLRDWVNGALERVGLSSSL